MGKATTIAGDAFSVALPGTLDNRVFHPDGKPAGRIEKLLIDVNNGLICYTEIELHAQGDARLHGNVRLPWATLLANKSGGYTLTPNGEAIIDKSIAKGSA